MKIAIIGSGISGITAACLLHKEHDITVFEAEERIGGHTHTVEVAVGDRTYAVDTGFIVYNEATYPNFIRLLERFKVPTQWSDMSFSVEHAASGRAYASHGLRGFFPDARTMASPAHWNLLLDIFRFNVEAKRFLARKENHCTLGEFQQEFGFSDYFAERYLVPLFSSIWSAAPGDIADYPASYFLNFFKNHGLLEINTGPRWRVIQGGSRSYAEAFTHDYRDRIRLNTPVRSIRRDQDSVTVQPVNGEAETYDQVILAVHSNTVLSLLEDPCDAEREILAALPYQDNDVVLHTDESLLPRNWRARASWNYYLPEMAGERATLTYDMTRLQSLDTSMRFCVSLNSNHRIDPAKVIRRFTYAHPIYTARGIAAQSRHKEISGQRRTHFCGAYWGYGFHEDGVKSALEVAQALGRSLSDA